MYKPLGKFNNQWVYDINPYSSDFCVVIGPEGLTPEMLWVDWEDSELPLGYRWMSSDEWEQFTLTNKMIRNQKEKKRLK